MQLRLIYLKSIIRRIIEPFVGNLDARKQHQINQKNIPSISEAINNVDERWHIQKFIAAHDKPIFLLSAGWRSGSTLVQRLINSSNDILIWGEPYSNSDYIRKLADALAIFHKDTPPHNFFVERFIDPQTKKIADQWSACLYPDPGDLWIAHRSFYLSLFAKPATQLGFDNWGLKEVRLDFNYAVYLSWLFPQSKFIFLYRNPYEAYRSYRTFGCWYDRWPSQPVLTARQFGLLWKDLLSGYLHNRQKLNAFLIKYEDLTSGDYPFEALNSFLGNNIDPSIIKNKISGRTTQKANKLPLLERHLLATTVEPLAGQLGYSASQ